MKKYFFIILGIIVVFALASAPFVVEYLQEKKADEHLIATYSYHKDFWTIYPVIKESLDIVKKNKNHDGAYDSLAQSYYTLGALDEAQSALQKALAIKPENDAYWFFLGKVYQAKKIYPESARAYEKALELNPTKKEHFQALAWLYYFRFEGEEHKKSFDILKKGLEKFETDKDLLFDITRYNFYDSRAKEFLQYAPKYLAVNPSDTAMRKDYEQYKKIFSEQKNKK